MGIVDGLTKARLIALENNTIRGAMVSGDNLIMTRGDGTQYVAGNVRGPAAPTPFPNWTAVGLLNSWVNYNDASGTYSPFGYCIMLGVVYLRGLVKSGTLTAAIATLPAEARPEYDKIFSAIVPGRIVTTGAASTGTAHTHSVTIPETPVRLGITKAGSVALSSASSVSSNAFVSVDGISYPATPTT